MATFNNQFKKYFNLLDGLCKEKYPNENGYNAMRKFAATLNKKDETTLKNIIQMRNTFMHESRDLIEIKGGAVDFMKGLIEGLKRSNTNKIDSDFENRRKVVIGYLKGNLTNAENRISYLDYNTQNSIRNKLKDYIKLGQNAKDIDQLNSILQDSNNFLRNIHKLPAVQKQNRERKEYALERSKREAIMKIEEDYSEALQEAHSLNIFKRSGALRRINSLRENAVRRINQCQTFDELEDVVDDLEYDCDFDDILDDYQ